MARRKNPPEAVQLKTHLAQRLRQVRTERFGSRGGSAMARRLGVPIRTWYNYEQGVTVPAEVLLRFIELTGVEPLWLLHGQGPTYRDRGKQPRLGIDSSTSTVQGLLRSVLARLERPAAPNGDIPATLMSSTEPTADESVPTGVAPNHFVRVEGNAMAPIAADGAVVVYTDIDVAPEDLDGQLVVAWRDGRPLVRWFDCLGRWGLLRAHNPAEDPTTILIDFDVPIEERLVRRVLWISTPHR